MRDFIAEVLPDLAVDRREVAMETIKMTMSETGRRISEERHLLERSEVYADAVADMFCAYLDRLSANG
ncbi:TetR family transcriptional regulator [Sphingomonas sp. LH128]|nr:TetR family transcriptional regulator [Sphingomonas sp. LH128]